MGRIDKTVSTTEVGTVKKKGATSTMRRISIRSGRRILAGTMAVLLSGSVACTPIPGGDGNNNGNTGGSGAGTLPPSASVFRAPRAVPDFFAANEPWTFAAADEAQTRGVIVFGVGDLIETILLGTDRDCTFSHPSSQVTYDGSVLSIATEFTALNRSSRCAMRLEADGSACAGGPLSQACTLQPEPDDASVTISGSTFPLVSPSFVRIPTCTHSLFRIVNGGDWAILNFHPISATNAVPENAGGVVLVVGGTGFSLSSATLCPRLDSRGDCIGCGNVRPTGRIDANGDDLTLQLDFASGAAQCSITFNGTARYCATFDQNPADGISGPPLFRIEGEGTYRSGNSSGSLNVLYLFGEEPFIRR